MEKRPRVSAGKGDKWRPTDTSRYGRNFQAIRKECGCVLGEKCSCEKIRIRYADEMEVCDCCEEPWCEEHGMHYADCECVGPMNAEDEGYTLKEIDGELYGFRPQKL